MRRRAMCGVLWLLSMAVTAGAAPQQPAAASAPAPDYSKEPYILEADSTRIVLEKDGTSTQDSSVRVRVQSAAGVKAFGLLRFSYPSATSTLEIESVRVLKPDGKVVETPLENAVEMPAEVTRLAPFYSDLKEKQLAVRGLEEGDRLEFRYRAHVHAPLDPAHFWFLSNFTKDAIALQEELQLRLPQGQYVKVQSRKVQPVITEEGAYKVFTWKTASLEHKPSDKQANAQAGAAQGTPDVQITTFRSWEEVGDWFRGLMKPRTEPTAEIRAKEAALTRGASDDAQKVHALYKFVATKIRYIGVALGIGRFQPHAAADVLANEYGDCKDKHALLASLLSAAGFQADAALANSGWKIDPEVPSPGQFDHMVSVLPQGQALDWMDTTVEVAPEGYLMPALRDKQVLLIPASGPARLVTTPANPPFLSVFDFQMDGALDDQGTLTGKAKMTVRGDLEVLLRLAYRQAGEPQWNEVTQKLAGSLGFGGTVSNATVDPPEATESGFHIRYQYTRKEFGDWANRRIPAALPPVLLPEAPGENEKNPEPLDLEGPVEFTLRSDVKLPAGMTPQLPHQRSNSQDFADYSTKASFAGGILHVERVLSEKASRVQPSEFEKYRKFRQDLFDDWNSMIPLRTVEAVTPATSESPEARDGEAPITSANPEATDAYGKGTDAARVGEIEEAIRWFRVAVQKDPQFGAAWFDLGVAHYNLGVLTDAAEEVSRAIALEHSFAGRGKLMARKMQASGRRPEALKIWKAVAKANPDDADAIGAIAGILITTKQYAEAIPELEAAISQKPRNAGLQLLLAQALLPAGKKDQGLAALDMAVQLAPGPNTLNSASYILAEDGSHLEQAKEWAFKAIAAVDSATFNISLESLSAHDLTVIASLAPYWDTLGWVYFRTGELQNAHKYLRAAWELGEIGVIGDHLGQVLEKQGRTKEAAQLYAQAIAARGAPERTRARLIALMGGTSQADQAVQKALSRLVELRSINLPLVSRETSSADFYMLFQNGQETREVRFIEGNEKLREAAKALQGAAFDISFPDTSPVKIVRRGVLGCQQEPASCTFVMISPEDARSAPVPPPVESGSP